MALTPLQLKHSAMTFSQLQGEDPFTEWSGTRIRDYMAKLAGMLAAETGVTVVAPVLTLDELGPLAARDALLTFDQLLGEYPEKSGAAIRAYMDKLAIAQADVIELERLTRAANALGLTVAKYQEVKPYLDQQAAARAAQDAWITSPAVVAAVNAFRAAPTDFAAWDNLSQLLANAPTNYIEMGDPTAFQAKYGRQEYLASSDVLVKYPDIATAFIAAGERFNPQGGMLSMQNLGPALALTGAAATLFAFPSVSSMLGTTTELSGSAATVAEGFTQTLGITSAELAGSAAPVAAVADVVKQAATVFDPVQMISSPAIETITPAAVTEVGTMTQAGLPELASNLVQAVKSLAPVAKAVPAEVISSPAIETITPATVTEVGTAAVMPGPSLLDKAISLTDAGLKTAGTVVTVGATGVKVAETIKGKPDDFGSFMPVGEPVFISGGQPQAQDNGADFLILLGAGLLALFI